MKTLRYMQHVQQLQSACAGISLNIQRGVRRSNVSRHYARSKQLDVYAL